MTLDLQFKTMLAMIIAGFCVGINLESFTHFKPYWYGRSLLRYMLEILFWGTQTVLVFFLLYKVNAGELRFYLFLAFLLGYSIYKALFAKIYKEILLRTIQIVKKLSILLGRLIKLLIIRPMFGIGLILWAILLFCIRLIMTPLFYFLQVFGKMMIKLVKRTQKYLPKALKNKLYKFSSIYGIIKGTLVKLKNYLTF